MGTQNPLTLSHETRAAARAALERAFQEAASMPGTLLPHELLDGLIAAALAIVAEVAELSDGPLSLRDGASSRSHDVEHTVDATLAGLAVGRRLLPADALEELGIGLFLQDIGKLALPPFLVRKRAPLAPDEHELMMQHPVLGLPFLRDARIGAQARSVVRSHHERWDGSGYPDGLMGREPSLFARIAAVAGDLHAAREGAGSAFDPDVVAALREAVEPYPSRSSAAPTMVSASSSWWR